MKKIFILIMIILMFNCSNKNISCELSKANSKLVNGTNSKLVNGTKIYAEYSFSIFRIKVNGINYLVNSKGGIIKESE